MCVFIHQYVYIVEAVEWPCVTAGSPPTVSPSLSNRCCIPAGQGFLWSWPYLNHGKPYSVKYWAVTSSWPPQRPWWHYLECSTELQLNYVCQQDREKEEQSSCRKAAVSMGIGWKNWNGNGKNLEGWSSPELKRSDLCPGLTQKWKKHWVCTWNCWSSLVLYNCDLSRATAQSVILCWNIINSVSKYEDTGRRLSNCWWEEGHDLPREGEPWERGGRAGGAKQGTGSLHNILHDEGCWDHSCAHLTEEVKPESVKACFCTQHSCLPTPGTRQGQDGKPGYHNPPQPPFLRLSPFPRSLSPSPGLLPSLDMLQPLDVLQTWGAQNWPQDSRWGPSSGSIGMGTALVLLPHQGCYKPDEGTNPSCVWVCLSECPPLCAPTRTAVSPRTGQKGCWAGGRAELSPSATFCVFGGGYSMGRSTLAALFLLQYSFKMFFKVKIV